jgi:HEAT repeat protein/TolA-binding protein
MTMRMLNLTLILAAAGTLGAQQSPRRPIAPPTPMAPSPAMLPSAPMEPMTPMPAMAPMPPMPSMAVSAPDAPWAPMTPMPAMAPMAPMEPMTPMPPSAPMLIDFEMSPFFQGQGRVLSREEAARIAERAREQAELQRELSRLQTERTREYSRIQTEMTREQQQRISEIAREQARIQSEVQREQARMQSQITREQQQQIAEIQREQARANADMAREQARINGQFAYTTVSPSIHFPTPAVHVLPERAPAPWAQNDPADSLYKVAYQTMNSGDYRKAAQLFKELPQKFKYSQYAVDAMYWQAHSLYRVGSTSDLQEALQVLETLKATYPTSRIRGSNADVGALQVRIAGVLSTRGMGTSKIVRDVLEQNKTTCDNEEVQIRAAALNALMQTDPAAAQEYAIKMLAKKDDCSRELRSSAVSLIGSKRDPSATRTLIDVSKNDPSQDVRSRAIEYLGRMPGDEALAALEDLLKTSDDQQVQRSAIRALANNSSPRARAGIKALIERSDVNEALRRSALSSLSSELATTEDVNWLQSLYGKTESQSIRTSIINAMARLGGSQNEKWFTTLANNENEPIEVRLAAIRQAGPSMDIATLGRLYDQTGQRHLRNEIVRQLGNRREPESIDKLGEIIKNGTDPDVRRNAISALGNKKDDRATKLLLQLIDRP